MSDKLVMGMVEELNELLEGLKNSQSWWDSMIVKIEKELAGLQAQQTPKYTAKDFPYLDYFFGHGIAFIDNDNEYYISAKLKMISNPTKHSNEYIDNIIDIVECKLSDIKAGDYFADANPNGKTSKYMYCTSFYDDYDGRYIYYDCGDTGYIRNARIRMTDEYVINRDYVKFILKDK